MRVVAHDVLGDPTVSAARNERITIDWQAPDDNLKDAERDAQPQCGDTNPAGLAEPVTV